MINILDNVRHAQINLAFSLEKKARLIPKLEGSIEMGEDSGNPEEILEAAASLLAQGKLESVGIFQHCKECSALQILSPEEKSTIVRKLSSDGEGKVSLHCSLFDAFAISQLAAYKAKTLGCSSGVELAISKDSPVMRLIASEKPTEPCVVPIPILNSANIA